MHVLSTRRRWMSSVAGVAVVAASAVLLSPTAGQAQPQAYAVQLDGASPAGHMWSFMRFFPSTLAVTQGDTVTFTSAAPPGAPHSVTLVPTTDAHQWRADNQGAGGMWAPFVPDTAVGGDDDQLDFNPLAATPTFAIAGKAPCGTTDAPCTFDGSGIVNSGALFGNPAAPPTFTVQIAPNTPPGQYTVLCLLHPGMEMTLTVLPVNSTVQSPAQATDRGQAELQHALTVDAPAAERIVQQVHRSRIKHGHVRVSIHAGAVVNGASVAEFRDRRVVVHKGDRIRVLGSPEIHNLAFPVRKVIDWPFIVTQCEAPGADVPAASPADCDSPQQFQAAFNPKVVSATASRGLRKGQVVTSGVLTSPNVADGMVVPFRERHTFIARERGRYHGMCNVHGAMMNIVIRVKR